MVCPLHGANQRALHDASFRGIVETIEEIIITLSGVGTTSFSYCPNGYPWNFEGVVRALEDLNLTASGIVTGGGAVAVVSGVVGGEGISVTASGNSFVIAADLRGEGLVDFSYDGSVGVISGFTNTVLAGDNTSITTSGIFSIINSAVDPGPGPGGGVSVVVSGDPGDGYEAGSLWFDTNQGRLFVYASGGSVTEPAWYQTNAEALAVKGEVPPSGIGLNAPPRDGQLWFNSLLGSLFVYDTASSGWYEAGPSRSFAYSPAAPPPSVEGAGWFDTSDQRLKVWDGANWIDLAVDGGSV